MIRDPHRHSGKSPGAFWKKPRGILEKAPGILEKAPGILEKAPGILEKVPGILENVCGILEEVPARSSSRRTGPSPVRLRPPETPFVDNRVRTAKHACSRRPIRVHLVLAA